VKTCPPQADKELVVAAMLLAAITLGAVIYFWERLSRWVGLCGLARVFTLAGGGWYRFRLTR